MAGVAMIRISPTIRLEMSAINESLTAAVANGSLLESAKTNITALLGGTTSAVAPLLRALSVVACGLLSDPLLGSGAIRSRVRRRDLILFMCG